MSEYPRVTEILRYFVNFGNATEHVLKRAAERGSTVHSICAGIAKDAFVDDDMIDPYVREYVTSFRQWVEAQVLEFLVVEHRYVDEGRGYTGQIDFVIKGTDEQIYLVDIKTSSGKQKTYPLQLAAYKELLKLDGIDVVGSMLVYLNKAGKFPDIDLYEDLTEETETFLSALQCWKYFNKRKLDGRKKIRSARIP